MVKKMFLMTISLLIASTVLFADMTDTFFTGNAPEHTNASFYIRQTSTGAVQIAGEVWIKDRINFQEGLGVVENVFNDVLAADTDVVKGVAISTTALVAGTSAWIDVTQPEYPRQLTFAFDNLAVDTMAFTGTVTFAGTDVKGVPISEVMLASGNGVVYRSSYCYAHLNSFTPKVTLYDRDFITETRWSTIRVCVGTGRDLGLISSVVLSTDITHIAEGNATKADVAVAAARVNIPYQRYVPSNSPDGSVDYFIWQKNKGR